MDKLKEVCMVGLIALGGLLGCLSLKRPSRETNALEHILETLREDSLGRHVLENKDAYGLQIIYTQIDRRSDGRISFRSFYYNVDSTRYFYPASMVKMPVALLALEKLNRLQKSAYPSLSRDTPYRIDSLRPYQQQHATDSTAPHGWPSLAHDIRKLFVVSDNPAYNHLFDFLGMDEINQALRHKGYTRTGIVHRFYAPQRDQRYACPIVFYDPATGHIIYQEEEKVATQHWDNPQHSTAMGKGWINAAGERIDQPFDMRSKNWFALTDMEKMLRAILFPQAVPPQQRFNLSDDDYRFVWRYMGLFPRECDWPRYDAKDYPDDFVKYFLFSDSITAAKNLRIFNKVGQAYGTMTDVSYIANPEQGVEFILAATLLCNADGIFNDDRYEYETVGRPFLKKLSWAVYHFEQKRPRKRQLSIRESPLSALY